jgi:hypothetical protein
MTLLDLHNQRAKNSEEIRQLQGRNAAIDKQVMDLAGASVRMAFDFKGNQSGTVSVKHSDGVVLKADISKKVEWDSNALLNVANRMPWELVQQVFKIEFSVPEKSYKTLSSLLGEEFVKSIEAARTTKYGELKITTEVKA